ERQVGGEHHRRVGFGRGVRVRHAGRRGRVSGRPLRRAAGSGDLLPLVAVQVVEEVVVPLHGIVGPGTFQPAGDRVAAAAAAETVLPAQALLLQAGALGFGSDVRAGGRGAVR